MCRRAPAARAAVSRMPDQLTHTRAASRRALSFALVITAVVLVAEVAGGIMTNSLALLADDEGILGQNGFLELANVLADAANCGEISRIRGGVGLFEFRG